MLEQYLLTLQSLLQAANDSSWVELALKFFPFALLLELPLYLLLIAGLFRYGLRQLRPAASAPRAYPRVSCIITCYAEGADVRKTLRSLVHQDYPGVIEIIPIVDGAAQNPDTLRHATQSALEMRDVPRRIVRVIPKWQRGGRVSALNLGLSIASGEIVMALDGDTSFDNDMVSKATAHFDDPKVVAVSGALRVRNTARSLAARLQGLEYMLSLTATRTALSEFNLVPNISGAFGVFRRSFIDNMGGWDAGTAEDLDITTRIKQYLGRYPDLRIVFEPQAVGHTDAPESFAGFFRQRLRWEGDLFYVLIRKYRFNLRPRLLGWQNFLFVLFNGLVLQMTMPFLIIGYTAALLFVLPFGAVLGVLSFVYLIYLSAIALYFALYLAIVSERPRHDLKFSLYLPLFPVFAMASRIHSAFALLQEILFKSHLDSSMAPWWVLRKTKF